MNIKKISTLAQIMGGDKTTIREVFHPKNEKLPFSYSLAHATLGVGESSLPHIMSTSEVYYILSGEGTMHINDESQAVRTDTAIEIPIGATQYIENTGSTELAFLCIVSPAWREDDEKLA